jgi:hypothetical protein
VRKVLQIGRGTARRKKAVMARPGDRQKSPTHTMTKTKLSAGAAAVKDWLGADPDQMRDIVRHLAANPVRAGEALPNNPRLPNNS